jgi:hypothetical protein
MHTGVYLLLRLAADRCLMVSAELLCCIGFDVVYGCSCVVN